MKYFGLAFLAVLSLAVFKVRAGQVKTVCILIPAYNPEDFAEGENEEEEITGWGPGPALPTANRQPIVTTYTEGEEDGGQGSPEGGVSADSSAPSVKAAPKGPMTDPSKPPGPNPKWGYWEWDSESGQWELEDFRRKRRQAPGSVLAGKLQCGPGTIIHVDKVTLGFSIDNRCRPVRPSCQATSKLGRQVSHCEGQRGVCNVTVAQQFLQLCGRRTNYAKIQYECIEESEKHNICEAKSFTSAGSLLLSSPSFSGSEDDTHAEYLSCECEITRGESTSLSVPWVRTKLDTGDQGVCGEEMLLLDTWDEAANRFQLQEELCGQRSVRDKTFSTSVVKLTYIPSFNHLPTNGFLFKIQGKPDPKAELQVTCSVVSSDDNSSPKAAPPPPSPAQPSSQASGTASQPARPRLPPNFNFNKYPGLLNKTLTAWRSRMNQEGSVASQTGLQAQPAQGGAAGAVVQQGSELPNADHFNVSGTSGTLSAVVASLASVILIMGSLGAFFAYKRYQKKKKQNTVYYDSRSTVRSDAGLYSEATYQDPAGPGSSIPTALPFTSPANTTTSTTTSESQKPSEPAPKTARRASSDGHAPALPKRPPRPKKDKCRRLADEEEVAYDNAAPVTSGDVTLLKNADYASLEDISKALGSQDSGTDVQLDLSETEEVEVQTEA